MCRKIKPISQTDSNEVILIKTLASHFGNAKKLAKHINISKTSIDHWLNYHTKPRLDNIIQLQELAKELNLLPNTNNLLLHKLIFVFKGREQLLKYLDVSETTLSRWLNKHSKPNPQSEILIHELAIEKGII
jgi:transcriptional regulator with XRE-family HTH domain